MTKIKVEDWSFENIRSADPERAARLESAGTPVELINELGTALRAAIESGQLRFSIDSICNKFVECRTILQFPVDPSLYDWFFNARTGYRAQFWLSPELGMNFNFQIVEILLKELSSCLPPMVAARKIEVDTAEGSRSEKDVGFIEKPRDEILKTLVPDISKIWICENLYGAGGSQPEPIGHALLIDAALSSAKLAIPIWEEATNPKTGEKGEGLRAPSPDADYSWLDLKGGFLGADGIPTQVKCKKVRANQIHQYGWTW